MNAAEWRRAKSLISEAFAQPPESRSKFLADACPDRDVRAEIAALLESCDSIPEIPEEPSSEPEPTAEATTTARFTQGAAFGPGQRAGPYVFETFLGRGGMGEVYLAHDSRLDRRVAIKVLSRRAGAQPDLRRVLREARAAAQLNDPRIATVHDVLDVDGRSFIVMEFVPGQTLAQRARGRRLSPEEVARIGMEVATALVHAHRAGIIHCDLKPANIKLTNEGALKILDFGLARRTDPALDATPPHSSLGSRRVVAGTPGYMSPEQLLGRTLDARTDIFSLGVMLFELATGARPFRGSDVVTRALSVMTDPTPEIPAELPASLREVIRRCLEKDPAARFQSAADVCAALEAAVKPADRIAAAPRTTARWRIGAVGAVAALVGVVLITQVLPRIGVHTPSVSGVGVVLPFSATQPGPATAVATGLADLLASDLADVPGFVLIPRTAALKYSADPAAFPGIVHDLGADYAITGALEQGAGRSRVVISLVDLRTGKAAWSSQFTGDAQDIFGLEQRIADALLKEIRISGRAESGQARATRVARPTPDRQALEDYSQGRAFLDRPDDVGNLDRALKLFESAVARDRRFALAYAAIGDVCWQKYTMTKDPAWTDRARAATLDALRLDPNQPMVRYALAVIYRGTGRREEAIEELQKAIQLQPSSDEFHRFLGRVYGDMNRTDAAVAEFTLAKALRPGFWDTYRALGLVYYQAGKYDDAIAALKRATELQPDSNSGFQMLGTAYHAKGDLDNAVASYDRANAIKPSAPAWSNIGMIRHQQKHYADAVLAYKQSIALRPKEPATFRNLGDAYTQMSDAANARTAYQRAIELAKEVLAVNPKAALTLALQALCEAKLQHFDEAGRLASQAVALSPGSGEVLYQQAIVETLANHEDRAVAALRAAVERGFSRQLAREDDDLVSLRRRPDVAALLREP